MVAFLIIDSSFTVLEKDYTCKDLIVWLHIVYLIFQKYYGSKLCVFENFNLQNICFELRECLNNPACTTWYVMYIFEKQILPYKHFKIYLRIFYFFQTTSNELLYGFMRFSKHTCIGIIITPYPPKIINSDLSFHSAVHRQILELFQWNVFRWRYQIIFFCSLFIIRKLCLKMILPGIRSVFESFSSLPFYFICFSF